MPPLPHREQAILDVRKLEDYCLDAAHSRGRHKARVFREALGIGRGDAGWFRRLLLQAVRESDATELKVRTVWIVRIGERAPRFVSCWVL